MKTNKFGLELLQDSYLNKDTAFTPEERIKYKLEGLLPPVHDTIETQMQRVYLHLATKSTDLGKYIYLSKLHDRNETLFFKVLMSDPAQFVPIMYAPTVGEACTKFSEIYRDKCGMFISLKDKGNIKEILRNWHIDDVRFICVSSGGRILGLGDLGANGMGIPLGKLQIYTACGAVPPKVLLPILLDMGTDNEVLLRDRFYIGLKQHRPNDTEVDAFVEEFVQAVQEVFPKCCIHFEDWKGVHAIRLLERYKDKVLCYNDDIQGTGAVAVGTLYGAMRLKKANLREQRILMFGAGSAGTGIAGMICKAMELEGATPQEAINHLYLFDSKGLIVSSRANIQAERSLYAKDLPNTSTLLEAIHLVKPTVIIGTSTVGGAFDEEVLRAMAEINQQPIILALSNPTEHAECNAEEAYRYTDGRAIFCAGVPFPTVDYMGKKLYPGQANNFYCFPGVSMAIYATQPKLVGDEVWIRASKALADAMTQEHIDMGLILPPQEEILEVSTKVAIQVAEDIFNMGLAQVERPKDIDQWIREMQYKPVYPEFD